jgi:hypothetical protein
VVNAVSSFGASGREFKERSCLEVHNVHILAIEGLIVPGIAERPACVKCGWVQFLGLLGILENLVDLLADEIAGGFVGRFARGKVFECPKDREGLSFFL